MWRKVASIVIVGLGLASCSFETAQFLGDAAPDPITVGFAQQSSLQDEASNNIEVIVRLSEPARGPIEVTYTFDTGASSANAQDYEGADGTLMFQAGETERGIPVKILPDALEEPNEVIVVRLSNATGALLGVGRHDITINSSVLPRVNFSLASSSGLENGGNLTLNLMLDSSPLLRSTVSVALNAAATTAAQNFDFTLPVASVTFEVGELSKTIEIPIVNDTMLEDDETFTVEIASTENLVAGTTIASRTHTIMNDDASPVLAITSATTTQVEGAANATTQVTLTVTQSAPSGRQTTVGFQSAGSTANDPADYTYATTGLLTFPATQDPASTPPTRTIVINVLGDAIDEDDNTVITQLINATNANVSSTNGAFTLTITDDDLEPVVTFVTANGSSTEGDSGVTTVNYGWRISGLSEKTLTFDIALTGTATYTADYTSNPAATMGTVPISVPGTTTANTNVNFSLMIKGEEVVEGANETIIMTIGNLGNLRGPASSADLTRTHTINDQDPDN